MSNSSSTKESKVYVLYTGGTFGMSKAKGRHGSLAAKTLGELKKDLDPKAYDLPDNVEIHLDEIYPPIDSSSMKPSDWVKMVQKIEENYDEHDAIIVIQGTDTLSYTASALSFMLENLSKPVIVTGSQLPLENARSDGRLNYGHALQLAAYRTTDLPLIPEVVVVFADKVLRGCRTRKMSASAWTGFETPNCAPLGEIGEHLRIYENQLRPLPAQGMEFKTITDLEEGVLDMAIFPGLTGKKLDAILKDDDIKGVILRTYGTGNAPEDSDFFDAINDAGIDGKTVVNISQCPQGTVEMGLYQASVGLVENGVISGLDMTPEAALTKLMVNLKNRNPQQLKLQMQVNQRGEQTFNLFDLRYDVPKESFYEKYSAYTVPDRRFNPSRLNQASIRIMGAKVNGEISDDNFVDVYMNHLGASREDTLKKDHKSRVARISAQDLRDGTVVSSLSKEQTMKCIGDSDIELTLVTSSGDFSVKFDRLALSLFTQS